MLVPNITEDPDRFRNRDRAGVDAFPQRVAVDERHRVVRQTATFAGPEHGHDVGMLKAGGEARLTGEPFARHRGREPGVEQFRDDAPSELRVGPDKHTRHPSRRQLLIELNLRAQCRLQLCAEVACHGRGGKGAPNTRT